MTRLIVPLSLDALVVRRGDPAVAPARTAWQAAARPALNAAPRRQDLAPPPFTDTAAPRASGVHLHWAMPDALLRGSLKSVGDGSANRLALPPLGVALRWHPLPVAGDRRQQLVLIGVDFDKESQRMLLESCLLTDEEMRGGIEAWKSLPDPFPAWHIGGLQRTNDES